MLYSFRRCNAVERVNTEKGAKPSKKWTLQRTRKNLVKTASKHGLLPHWVYIANMCRISIPAIWDVIWGQTNLFLMLYRPPNLLSRKDQSLKNWILDGFWLSQKALYNACKVLSKELRPQVKNLDCFFSQTRSRRVLIGF